MSKLAPWMPVLLLALAGWALLPGATGGFVFDDYVNLPALGDFGRIDNFHAVVYYLTAGLGDPIGRPLSQLSFLIDARDWPASPAPFLRTNILLHLVNAALLCRVLVVIGRLSGWEESRARWSALGGAALWALHPLFLSTTLYIVQRESMLVALFALLGFLAWLHGRDLVERGRVRGGLAFMVAGSLGCTLLAVLCKANGALLPLLLLVAELTVLPAPQANAAATLSRARRVLLVLPSLLLLVALAAMIPWSIESTRQHRAWTLAERLLTEPRVILDYIGALLMPRPLTSGVFHDDFVISTDLLHPWTTLPAILLISALIGAAWACRRRWPRLSFAVLFFFCGHLLEGSVIPLELYFEHRNYLPAIFLFWPLADWLLAPGRGASLRRVAAVVIVVMLAFDTHVGASIWGQPEALARAWAIENPGSPRAQVVAAQYELRRGDTMAARARVRNALARNPREAQLAFTLADIDCSFGKLEPETVQAMRRSLHESENTARLGFGWLSAAVARASRGECAGLDLHTVEILLDAIRTNPRFAEAVGRQLDFAHIDGLIALARNDPDAALAAFDRGIALKADPEAALKQAAQLAGAGRPDLALQHLRMIDCAARRAPKPWPAMVNVHAWLLHRWGYWENEVAELERKLADEARHLHDAPDATPPEALPRPCPATPSAEPA